MSEIEPLLEALGIKFWSTGHDYCEEHDLTWDCYQPHCCFDHRGHGFEINRCHLQGKWVVRVGDVRHLVDEVDEAVELVANIEPRADEVAL